MPFLRLGLANLPVVFLVARGFYADALLVTVGKTILGNLLAGTIFSLPFLLSGAGSLLAWLTMVLLNSSKINFSEIGLSMAGAYLSFVGQFFVLSLVLQTNFWPLWPYLSALAIFSGAAVGFLARLALSRLERLENYAN